MDATPENHSGISLPDERSEMHFADIAMSLKAKLPPLSSDQDPLLSQYLSELLKDTLKGKFERHVFEGAEESMSQRERRALSEFKTKLDTELNRTVLESIANGQYSSRENRRFEVQKTPYFRGYTDDSFTFIVSRIEISEFDGQNTFYSSIPDLTRLNRDSKSHHPRMPETVFSGQTSLVHFMEEQKDGSLKHVVRVQMDPHVVEELLKNFARQVSSRQSGVKPALYSLMYSLVSEAIDERIKAPIKERNETRYGKGDFAEKVTESYLGLFELKKFPSIRHVEVGENMGTAEKPEIHFNVYAVLPPANLDLDLLDKGAEGMASLSEKKVVTKLSYKVSLDAWGTPVITETGAIEHGFLRDFHPSRLDRRN